MSSKALRVAFVLFVSVACGNTNGGFVLTARGGNAGLAGIALSDPSEAGSSAQGGNTGFAGSVIVAAATTSKYGACVAYMTAQCQRRFGDCGERTSAESPCSSVVDRCPDSAFSPGATWTVVSLLSCAEEWKTYSCDDIRQNKRPSCAAPRGTRKVDEPCLFANQCASNACTAQKKDGTGVSNYDQCRVCGELSPLGGPCNTPGYECESELVCGFYSKQCEKRPTLGVIGATCQDDSTCTGYGISCRSDPSDGTKRCLAYPVSGESCADAPCADGYLCVNKVCAPGPASGQSCGQQGPAECGVGLVCTSFFDTPSRTCVAPRKLGELCLGDARRAPRGTCESGLRCDCGELDCDAKSGTCRKVHAEGESCGEANSLCAPGTICTDTKCVALDTQPALVKLCPQ